MRTYSSEKRIRRLANESSACKECDGIESSKIGRHSEDLALSHFSAGALATLSHVVISTQVYRPRVFSLIDDDVTEASDFLPLPSKPTIPIPLIHQGLTLTSLNPYTG